MAITVASSTRADYDSSPPVVINKPSGVAVGDLLLIFVGGKSNDPTTFSISGFTNRKNQDNGADCLALFSRTADASDVSASTYSVTVGDSEVTCAIMLRITGWDSGEDFSRVSSQSVDTGIFTTMDLTPAVANSLIVFCTQHIPNGETASGHNIVVSNPSWTVAETVPNAFSTGEMEVVWAVRPETTATGDFRVTDTGNQQAGIAIIIKPVTSTNYPMTASVGAFTLTGTTSLLKIGKKLVATVASFTLTGVNAITRFGRKMTGGIGAFTLTGISNILFFGKRISAETGVFVLTGVSAIVKSTRKITGGVASFTLTGINNIMFVGHTLVANVGTFILTGLNAIVRSTRRMSATVASFTLTGVDNILVVTRRIVAVTASFILTGNNVALSGGRKIVGVVASFLLTGNNALFPRASKIFANTGVFTLVGNIAIGLFNGSAQFWSAVVKNVESFTGTTKHNASMTATSKNNETWIAQDKS